MHPAPPLEAIVSLTPGEAVTRLVMAVAIDRMGGAAVAPRASAEGTRVPLPPRLLRGGGELLVTVRDERTRVRLVGTPPPWPLSLGWRRRCLARLLKAHVVAFEEVAPSPEAGA